jgi:calcium-dependent protein kinase
LKARGKYSEITREKVVLGPKEFYLEHKDNIKDHYELHENIGDPTTSRVRRGIHRMQKISRAIKVVRKEDLEFGERRKLLEEINLLKKLDHPNIVSVQEMFEDKKRLYFVSDMLQGGTIFERFNKSPSFSEHTCAKIVRQLLSAVSYLHS